MSKPHSRDQIASLRSAEHLSALADQVPGCRSDGAGRWWDGRNGAGGWRLNTNAIIPLAPLDSSATSSSSSRA
jgi:hypothetical protein